MTPFLVGLLVMVGMAMVVVGILLRVREREQNLADILDLPFGERDVPAEVIEQRAALVDGTVTLASKVVEQFDAKGSLSKALERARIPIRPGEFVIIVGSFAVAVSAALWLVTKQPLFVLLALLLSPLAARVYLERKVKARRKAFEAYLPDALSLIASSLAAGHTFLRSIQMMTEEAEPVVAEEFARVIYETRLGDSLVDALEKMAVRLNLRDLEWVVQAIRVQQTVGGKLADLLHTLADFIRAREEVRLEINALTAEGRISAWVLGALPVFLLLAISVMNKGYMKPMFQGWGLAWLAGTGASIVVGILVILKMVQIEV